MGIEALIGKVRFSRLGIKLAETHNKGYRWQHEAVIALATPDNVNAFELTPQEAEEWYRERDVYPQARRWRMTCWLLSSINRLV